MLALTKQVKVQSNREPPKGVAALASFSTLDGAGKIVLNIYKGEKENMRGCLQHIEVANDTTHAEA